MRVVAHLACAFGIRQMMNHFDLISFRFIFCCKRAAAAVAKRNICFFDWNSALSVLAATVRVIL